MAIAKKWSRYTKDNARSVTNVYGVYELADGAGNIAYIGEGKLRERLIAHLSIRSDPTPGVSYFRYATTGSKRRAKQRQNAMLSEFSRAYGRLPIYNQKRRG